MVLEAAFKKGMKAFSADTSVALKVLAEAPKMAGVLVTCLKFLTDTVGSLDELRDVDGLLTESVHDEVMGEEGDKEGDEEGSGATWNGTHLEASRLLDWCTPWNAMPESQCASWIAASLGWVQPWQRLHRALLAVVVHALGLQRACVRSLRL